ncbi:hypothetical protein K458DRAFT_394683 [Lentithecium fluviatile CBS 122367]|uniref:Uncharacterized protein n=1 Tax=Lentithecium fluviatile CBS 122367 TaxID=1168545 RepID=A0A6G1IK64_9PLEO|nr:hypothetical protein K458DRAFT_394683 [Lentithecium fluviatile CBS 122367]
MSTINFACIFKAIKANILKPLTNTQSVYKSPPMEISNLILILLHASTLHRKMATPFRKPESYFKAAYREEIKRPHPTWDRLAMERTLNWLWYYGPDEELAESTRLHRRQSRSLPTVDQ